jgi:hypothetical protein
MKKDAKPDPEKAAASSRAPEHAADEGKAASERVESFSRRALIEAGWTVPVILSVVLPERLLAQSSGGPIVIHADLHADLQVGVHSDAPFTDGTAHNDRPHGDTAHGDIHTDSSTTPPVHADVLHGDGFLDIGFADGGFADHADDSSSQHTDNAHVDSHTDISFPSLPPHADIHADSPHLDFAFNIHGDHSDGQPGHGGGGAFTDHTDGFCRTTHGDNSHGDENTHVDHYDLTPTAQLHEDHCDTPTGHADMQIGHIDAHADRHADIRHSDVHLDITTPRTSSRT